MSKLIPLLTLILISSSVLGAEPQFKNERAKKAEQAYQAKLKEARDAYIQELDVAIKEAGGAGDLDEANQIADVKEELEKEGELNDRDPLAAVRRKLEDSKWRKTSDRRAYHRFLKDNKTINFQGTKGVWVVTDETTALSQSYGSSNIYVFEFDKELKTATVFKFVKSKDKPVYFQR